jgi:hypothetical protein
VVPLKWIFAFPIRQGCHQPQSLLRLQLGSDSVARVETKLADVAKETLNLAAKSRFQAITSRPPHSGLPRCVGGQVPTERMTMTTKKRKSAPTSGKVPSSEAKPAVKSGTFRIASDLPIHRLGFGAMRITGDGIWGQPRDHDEVRQSTSENDFECFASTGVNTPATMHPNS